MEQKVSIVQILTGGAVPKLTADTMPTRDYEVPRLSKLTGQPVIFHLRGLTYGRCRDIARLDGDSDINILLEGCVEPNLSDEALQQTFGGPTPADAIKAMLLPGEIADLSTAVEQLSGYRMPTITEVKNGSGTAKTKN